MSLDTDERPTAHFVYEKRMSSHINKKKSLHRIHNKSILTYDPSENMLSQAIQLRVCIYLYSDDDRYGQYCVILHLFDPSKGKTIVS